MDLDEKALLACVIPQVVERSFVRRFLILAERRHHAAKSRGKFFDLMQDDRFLRPEVAVASGNKTTKEIVHSIRSHGGSSDAIVLSEHGEFDGRVMQLDVAIGELQWSGWATLMLCVSGPAGYYEAEFANDNRILCW